MSEHCTKEGDIAEIRTGLADLSKIVKCNGLQKAVTELNIVVPQLAGTVKELSGNVQILLNRKIGDDAAPSATGIGKAGNKIGKSSGKFAVVR